LDKKLKKEDELAQLRIDVKEKYKLYYKYNKRLATLADTEIQANKSNAFIRELVSLQALFFNKYPKEDSCIKLLFKKSDASLSESNMKRFQSFCDKVDEIEKIRNLKKEVIKKFERYRIQDDNKISLKDTPNEYTDEFLSFLGKHIKYQEEDFENEIKLLFLDEYKEHEISQTPIDILNNFLKFKIPKTKKKSPKREVSLRKILIYSISSILIIFSIFIFFVIREYNHRKQEDKKLAKENKIIENAKLIKATRTPQLISIYDAISRELNNDYGNDGIRNISSELKGRIISLSNKLTPYIYIKEGEIITQELSPERGELFLNLHESNLEYDTFYEIVTEANFTYSDFSNLDLSYIDFSKSIFGIETEFNNEVRLLLSTKKTIDFSYSNFRGAKLDNTTLYGTFSYCDFRDINSIGLRILWSSFIQSNFDNAKIGECVFKNASFNNSSFKNASLGGIKAYEQGFFNCDLRGVNFENSTISGGKEEFTFDNCFFSSSITFFNYKLNVDHFSTIYIEADPFLDGYDNVYPLNVYEVISISHEFDEKDKEVFKYDKPKSEVFSRFMDYKLKHKRNIMINNESKIFNKEIFDIKQMWNSIDDIWNFEQNAQKNKLYYCFIRTNDNLNRNWKVLRNFTSFYGTNWDSPSTFMDTLYRKSSPNKLQSIYRDVTYNHIPNDDGKTNGIASFKKCRFIYTSFKNSNMEFVNFENAIFEKYTENISNQFINIKLLKNNFKIKSGVFSFSKKTIFDSLFVNNNFPLLRYMRDKDSLTGKSYLKRMRSDKSYNPESHINISKKFRDSIVNWIRLNENKIELEDSDQNDGSFLLLKKQPKS